MITTCVFCNIRHENLVPTVHSNGTSAESLVEGLSAAIDALHEAQRLMCEAAPNGRDYYVQGNLAAGAAMDAHERRLINLNRMLTELEEQRNHVQAVIDYKEVRKSQEAR